MSCSFAATVPGGRKSKAAKKSSQWPCSTIQLPTGFHRPDAICPVKAALDYGSVEPFSFGEAGVRKG